MATIQDICTLLESIAPPAYQESYDNSGLLVGSPSTAVTGVLVSLDCVESVVEEAHARGCNLIVAHHPIVFGGLKRLTGRNYVERTVIRAIQLGIGIYAIHTNLDNVLKSGVNERIAQVLGLQNLQILAPKSGILRKLYTFAPASHADAVREALWQAGAGKIGEYDCCSFSHAGTGTFRASDSATPFVGTKGSLHKEAEEKIEVIFAEHQTSAVVGALLRAHPYEEVAYDLVKLENAHPRIGSGLVGDLPAPVPVMEFLQNAKTLLRAGCVRYTAPHRENVQRIALCGGAGSFLLSKAIGARADVFLTADYKYHEFFDADKRITIADVGHFESEQYTIDLLAEQIRARFAELPTLLCSHSTNPVRYL